MWIVISRQRWGLPFKINDPISCFLGGNVKFYTTICISYAFGSTSWMVGPALSYGQENQLIDLYRQNSQSCLTGLTFGGMSKRIIILSLLSILAGRSPLAGQDNDSVLQYIATVRTWKDSPARDSALSYNYNFLAEAYSGKKDSLALLYIDSLSMLVPVSKWNKAEGMLWRAWGKYHDRRGEFEAALDAYSRAISSLEKNKDQSDLLAYTYILKAFVLNNNGMQDECNQTLEQIRPLAEKLPNKNFLAWILDCYGDHHFYSSFGHQDFQKALQYYQQVETLLPSLRNKMIIADNAHGLAGCYARLGDEDKADYYRSKALDTAKVYGLHSVIFAVYGDQADVYEEKGDFSKAITYRLLGLEYAKQSHWIEMESRAERSAAHTFKLSGDFKEALHHFERFKDIEDSLARYQVQTRYHELEVKYQLGQKDLQIAQLKTKNLLLLLYILGSLLAGGGLFLAYYQWTNNKLKRQNEELYTKNLEIQTALTEGQNMERKRMAIELHDHINAKIAATKWMLETINTPEKSPEEQLTIHRLVDSLSDIYEDVRFISHNLVPKDIETKSLAVLIQQLIDKLNHNQRIQFELKVYGNDPGLHIDIKIQAYALIMELVNNIIRHSHCQHAWVTVAFISNLVHITIKDDGRGFDPNLVGSGTGLKNLEGRVKGLEGTMQILTGIGEGTLVEIKLPV